jgi:BolA protein
MTFEEKLTNLLQTEFHPTYLKVENNSSHHAGHASSPQTGESHFTVTMVAEKFSGLSRVNRHRLVNRLVEKDFAAGLHALSLTLLAPEEF